MDADIIDAIDKLLKQHLTDNTRKDISLFRQQAWNDCIDPIDRKYVLALYHRLCGDGCRPQPPTLDPIELAERRALKAERRAEVFERALERKKAEAERRIAEIEGLHQEAITEPPPLTTITTRHRAGLVGLLVERQELLLAGELYAIEGIVPENTGQVFNIDTGVMLVAIARRLGGDTVAAENALRDVIWRYVSRGVTDVSEKTPGDINLEIPKIMLDEWRSDPKNWFINTVSAACTWLHAPLMGKEHDLDVFITGKVFNEIWQLYSAVLTVLGWSTSRQCFGASE
jgi:hypothetical protein